MQQDSKTAPAGQRNLLAQPAKRLPRSGDENETERYRAYCDDHTLKNSQSPVALLARNEKFNAIDPLCNKVIGTDLKNRAERSREIRRQFAKDNASYKESIEQGISRDKPVKLNASMPQLSSRKFLVLEPLQAAL